MVIEWLEGVGADWLTPTQCFAFSENSFPQGVSGLEDYFTSGAWISWLGGLGISGIDWPTDCEGDPLSHVATFCLNEAKLHPEATRSWRETLNFPGGFVEIYHDLKTYGYEARDRLTGGWLIRHVKSSKGLHLVPPPAPLGERVDTVCQQGLLMPAFSFPAYSDLPDGGYDFALWEYCSLELQSAWEAQRFGKTSNYPTPFTHIGGDSWNGKTVVEAMLEDYLPLDAGDTHVLLATIESWTILNGYFGDAGNLEVWIRQSDLNNTNFEKAWCFIRTE
ncbi:DUF1963 domain-containing protein [Arcanobacterium canis]